ncbi:flagellar hook-basal body complex protein FliE [Azospirillum sp. RWY-5-1]|uniref:Flagellar hook-basal body complex protein FliE n=1 Tax=Azospirillum oleiclasticum TaxID=2735135 RepID=A0ABX2T3D7_9PROT|nr:flagellar hook-basal body complex protein FliE [Azospirillum oleiclasticum]NYZ11666.1 flagellar hook-basal body complex protein FliE [Azospirillum oleiclasticum]NYZ18827.1 flagellar hook-basal body complex protein FliE [Azospirillum oleiclasticum]
MATNIAGAIAAYANTAGRLTGPGIGRETPATSFGEVLENAARNTIGSMRRGEDMSALASVGKADITDVVQAVTNAEMTLQTVTAVRDKVVTAYQEILRMPI